MTDGTLQASETNGTGITNSTVPANDDTNGGTIAFLNFMNCLCGPEC